MKRMLCVCTLLLLVSGCGRDHQGQSIPFERVVTNGNETVFEVDAFYPAYTSAVFVAAPDQLSRIDAFVPHAQREVLHAAKLDGQLVMAVFRGPASFVADGVKIETVMLDQHQLYVHATFNDPPAEDLSLPSTGYATFDIVAVERAALPSGPEPLLVQVVDQDDTLVVSTTVTLSQ